MDLENQNLSLMTRVKSVGSGGCAPALPMSSLARGGKPIAPCSLPQDQGQAVLL